MKKILSILLATTIVLGSFALSVSNVRFNSFTLTASAETADSDLSDETTTTPFEEETTTPSNPDDSDTPSSDDTETPSEPEEKSEFMEFLKNIYEKAIILFDHLVLGLVAKVFDLLLSLIH